MCDENQIAFPSNRDANGENVINVGNFGKLHLAAYSVVWGISFFTTFVFCMGYFVH